MNDKTRKIIGIVLLIAGIVLCLTGNTVLLLAGLVACVAGALAFMDKIPFLREKKAKVVLLTPPEKLAKAFEAADKMRSEEAMELLEELVNLNTGDIPSDQARTKAAKALGELYEKGRFSGLSQPADMSKAVKYYAVYLKGNSMDGDVASRIAQYFLEQQQFKDAITYFEMAAKVKNRFATQKLANMFEEGIHKVDNYGNKGAQVIAPDFEKAEFWYQKLADMGYPEGDAGVKRVQKRLTNSDSVEFEEKEKIYAKLYEERKNAGVKFAFRRQDVTQFQYQYTYIHDEAEGYIHRLPKGWIKDVDIETDEVYYAKDTDDEDFRVFVTYDSIPKESDRPLDLFLKYQCDVLDYELPVKEYISEYADGICATFFRKEDEKSIISFAFQKQNRYANIKFICASPEIMSAYEEIIFEIANSFAFVNPSIVSEDSRNRKENQYYSEAAFYYGLDQYSLALEYAKKAQKAGSNKASYLIIELYYDDESPYNNLQKAVSYAEELFEKEPTADIAFLAGNTYEKLKTYERALEWYEKAYGMKHKRVPFYLGRLYYYGVLRVKRNGRKALAYFKEALKNGIKEAQAYIDDIESLGYQDLQETIDRLEAAVRNNDPEKAYEVAMKKKDQVFYLASDKEIENAFVVAYQLGNINAAYELGCIMRNAERNKENPNYENAMKYFEIAFDAGFNDFDSDALYEVVERKRQKGLSEIQQRVLYFKAAAMGHIQSLEKVIELTPTITNDIRKLYKECKVKAAQGEKIGLRSMSKLERAYIELVDLDPEIVQTKKVIQNKFFKLAVPKECVAVINDEGGTIKIADSVVDFAVAEMPIKTVEDESFEQVFELIQKEYREAENGDLQVVNSRLVGGSMLKSQGNEHSLSILLVSSKNQYLFKLSSTNRTELYKYKESVLDIAQTIVETGETFVETDPKRASHIGIGMLIGSAEGGVLSIGKLE